ncbi:unnamed protein product [Alternaria alternata]
MIAEESLAENFAIILRESEEALPLLVLGAANRKTLFIDTRLAETYSEAQLQLQPESNGVFVSKLETFDLEALHEALLQKPADISRGRYLRILQCVYKIGSPYILDSLKPALTAKRKNQTHQAMEQPVVEKLFRIYLYLDSQESESHLLVARSRYVNFKQGLCDELPPTPHNDEIHRIYEDLSPSEKKRRAQDIVKNEISRKVAKEHRIDEKRVRRNINSSKTHAPSLSTAEFRAELLEPEEKSLSRLIEIKDIEGLTQAEAVWFSKVLQARPGLLEQVPKTVLNLLLDSLFKAVDLRERDASSFRDRPLRFFA